MQGPAPSARDSRLPSLPAAARAGPGAQPVPGVGGGAPGQRWSGPAVPGPAGLEPLGTLWGPCARPGRGQEARGDSCCHHSAPHQGLCEGQLVCSPRSSVLLACRPSECCLSVPARLSIRFSMSHSLGTALSPLLRWL